MKTVVIGPGAIGCLFAASLAEAGVEVWLLDKDPERAREITGKGLRVDEPGGKSRRVHVPASATPKDVGIADLVCVCVKSYDTRVVRGLLPELLGPDSAVVSLQNGLGNVEELALSVPGDRVVCGATAHGATRLGPGHVLHAGAGVTNLAPIQPGGQDVAQRVASVLSAAGLDARLVDDAQGLLWSKLLINAAINPVTAVWDVRNGAIPGRAELLKVALGASEEGRKVAAAKGVRLLYPDVVAAVTDACWRTRDNMSSMLQDVRRGRRTEIDYINGAIVGEAATLGIDTPVNEMLVQRVRALTAQT